MRALFPLLALVAAPSFAQSVGECGDWSLARNLPEPWEENSATYANGQVRLALLDTLEPAATAMHLMILSPPLDELGDRQCKTVSLAAAPDQGGWPAGFMAIDFAARQADYDPQNGLQITLPVRVFNPDLPQGDRGALDITINQQTGQIGAVMVAE
ncbi:hypothetical protein [Paracoccus fistulariae]|uniref:Uncharacterized protein n=1 Tax=Paracoccus fistulariae TaxID=658446 RepID=A0ABY7SI80_9RHOB|nr:hypothetical protein [Paracoccus fistulariae]MDB6182167.1 hypothetical protein [Paracoccus fistulariae]WCR06609.1 hypothetical protein JHX87_14150 [Paracoccus fistulariae]